MFWSFFAAACTFVATPALAATGGIHLEVHSPSPLLTQTTDSCDWTYQALAGDQWTFDVAANIPRAKDDLMLMVREKNGWGIDNCPRASECTKPCTYVTYACNATKHASEFPSQWQYEVKAVYRQYYSSKTLCIQLNLPVHLRFASVPSNSTLSPLDNVTLLYFVTGYPLPAEVTLYCAGTARINRTVGVLTDLSNIPGRPANCDNATSAAVTLSCAAARFSLGSLPEGSLQCIAWASKGLADVQSPLVVIDVVSQPTSTDEPVPTDRPWSGSHSTSTRASANDAMTEPVASAGLSAGIGSNDNKAVWAAVGVSMAMFLAIFVAAFAVYMRRRKSIRIHVEQHAQAYVQIGDGNVMVRPSSQQADYATSENSLSTYAET